MKTPEDEAFDEIERRQGGGFKAKQAMAMDKVSPFEKWWYYEGSGPPQKGEDYEEHTKRMCEIAWSNGADVAAQPVQEPVVDSFEEYCKTLPPLWNTHISRTYAEQFFKAGKSAQREWVGLTDEDLADYLGDEYHNMTTSELRFFRLGEAAAKEKNA